MLSIAQTLIFDVVIAMIFTPPTSLGSATSPIGEAL